MRKKLAAVVVGIALCGGLSDLAFAQTDSINACVNNSGRVRLLQEGGECKKNERSVSWSSSAIVATDQNGQFVGTLAGKFITLTTLYVPSQEAFLSMQMAADSNGELNDMPFPVFPIALAYSEPGCAGTEYVSGQKGAAVQPMALQYLAPFSNVTTGTPVYELYKLGTPEQVVIQSYKDSGLSCADLDAPEQRLVSPGTKVDLGFLDASGFVANPPLKYGTKLP